MGGGGGVVRGGSYKGLIIISPMFGGEFINSVGLCSVMFLNLFINVTNKLHA